MESIQTFWCQQQYCCHLMEMMSQNVSSNLSLTPDTLVGDRYMYEKQDRGYSGLILSRRLMWMWACETSHIECTYVWYVPVLKNVQTCLYGSVISRHFLFIYPMSRLTSGYLGTQGVGTGYQVVDADVIGKVLGLKEHNTKMNPVSWINQRLQVTKIKFTYRRTGGQTDKPKYGIADQSIRQAEGTAE